MIGLGGFSGGCVSRKAYKNRGFLHLQALSDLLFHRAGFARGTSFQRKRRSASIGLALRLYFVIVIDYLIFDAGISISPTSVVLSALTVTLNLRST